MMDTRRDFLKKAILLSGSAGLSNVMPASIQKALNIEPTPGSTFLDAEHVVILMQENRSFDHCYGALRGVRGFNDPRAINLPDQNLVWLQTNKAGETYAPFRFDIRDTKITWMGSIPHSRSSQVDADNGGKYDQWLDAKKSGNSKYAKMPLTLGHYTREDIPFNYAMADAFTICDQHFSSAMTSTWPNRLYLWSATIRGEKSDTAKAYVRNDIPYGEANWMTFPERLEENNISWKVYQNDLTSGGGFTGEERSWLSNFGCNPLEYLSHYNVRFSVRYVQGLQKLADSLPHDIAALETKFKAMSTSDQGYQKLEQEIARKKEVLSETKAGLVKWSPENYAQLSEKEKNIYQKAFSTNAADPDYHELTTLSYAENGVDRELPIPKSDILYQFRQDVDGGKLPTVSWLVPPQNFSDHPSAPWYGNWYTSEILDILTKNPEVWKKTIFILTYDENDGYFDHIPPFVAPDPKDPRTGKCSPDINTSGVEYIRLQHELDQGIPRREARGGPIGLGFRVPMIIASPWSRGGKACSQVFDHTSTLQFLEEFLNQKYHKQIREANISAWRRTICGNLTAAFSLNKAAESENLPFLSKDTFIEEIYNAKFKKEPSSYKRLTPDEIDQINRDPSGSALMPNQESGVRTACPLPYQLYSDGLLSADRKSVVLKMQAGNEVFGAASAGSPFNVYVPGSYLTRDSEDKPEKKFEPVRVWRYAVKAGDTLTDQWPLDAFEEKNYHLRVYGPNGFYRELKGDGQDPLVQLECGYERSRMLKSKLTGNVEFKVINSESDQAIQITVTDQAYHNKPITRTIKAGGQQVILLDLKRSFGWYDFEIQVHGHAQFTRRYAGKVESGKESFSDPAMGRVKV